MGKTIFFLLYEHIASTKTAVVCLTVVQLLNLVAVIHITFQVLLAW